MSAFFTYLSEPRIVQKLRNKWRWTEVPATALSNMDVEEKLVGNSHPINTGRWDSDTDELPAVYRPAKHRTSRAWLYLTATNVLLFFASLLIAGWRSGNLDTCVERTSFYSPIFEEKQIKTHTVQLNGTLWPPVDQAWTRREPGDPIGEAGWESFEMVPTFPITQKQVIALGKDPKTVTRFENDFWGLGDDAYVASLDIQHKMHCLNSIRKMAFADYKSNEPTKPTYSQLWWLHMRHCMDMIAQDMLCHADADLVTYNWMDTQVHPFPDFAINRQCRDINPLIAYRDEHSVDPDKYMAMPKPSNAVQVPSEPGYYALYGFAGSDLFPNGQGHPPLPEPTWYGEKEAWS